MTTPIVTECPAAIAAVSRDPFIDDLRDRSEPPRVRVARCHRLPDAAHRPLKEVPNGSSP
jgi:hypothetical protein